MLASGSSALDILRSLSAKNWLKQAVQHCRSHLVCYRSVAFAVCALLPTLCIGDLERHLPAVLASWLSAAPHSNRLDAAGAVYLLVWDWDLPESLLLLSRAERQRCLLNPDL